MIKIKTGNTQVFLDNDQDGVLLQEGLNQYIFGDVEIFVESVKREIAEGATTLSLEWYDPRDFVPDEDFIITAPTDEQGYLLHPAPWREVTHDIGLVNFAGSVHAVADKICYGNYYSGGDPYDCMA